MQQTQEVSTNTFRQAAKYFFGNSTYVKDLFSSIFSSKLVEYQKLVSLIFTSKIPKYSLILDKSVGGHTPCQLHGLDVKAPTIGNIFLYVSLTEIYLQ